MSIGHEGDVTLDDRQASGLLRLTDGVRVDVARPGDELVVDVGGHVTPSLFLFVSSCGVVRWFEPASLGYGGPILAVAQDGTTSVELDAAREGLEPPPSG